MPIIKLQGNLAMGERFREYKYAYLVGVVNFSCQDNCQINTGGHLNMIFGGRVTFFMRCFRLCETEAHYNLVHTGAYYFSNHTVHQYTGLMDW
jgi:hypothetical protein